MLRTIRRLALAVLSAIALTAFVAPAAQAATATTLPATQVHTTTAVLNGRVDAGGLAAYWQFQWGRSIHYDKATPIRSIPPGFGAVDVSWKLLHLDPNTLYHFRLVAFSGIGTRYVETSYGRDRTFTTKSIGKLLLLSDRLIVSGDRVTVPLECKSRLACEGRFNINTATRLKRTHTIAHILCATTFFRIARGERREVKVRVRPACLVLLRRAKHHTIKAKFTSRPRTGQQGVIRIVHLVLR